MGKGPERAYRRVRAVRFTAAMCIVDPMSIAAALGSIGFNCEPPPIAILVMIHPSVQLKRRVWAMLIRHRTSTGITAMAVSPLSSAHQPMCQVF